MKNIPPEEALDSYREGLEQLRRENNDEDIQEELEAKWKTVKKNDKGEVDEFRNLAHLKGGCENLLQRVAEVNKSFSGKHQERPEGPQE